MLALLLSSFLTFVELNGENLFDCQHDSLKQDTEYLPDGTRHWTRKRYWRKLNNIAQELLSVCDDGVPDLIALLEVENDSVMNALCHRSLLRNAGYQYMMTNAGRMKTNSHELSLNAAIVQTKDWDVNLGINWTSVDNRVVELAEGVESIMLGGFVEPQVRAQAGCTYPNIYGYAFDRTEDGQLKLLDGLPQATLEMDTPDATEDGRLQTTCP